MTHLVIYYNQCWVKTACETVRKDDELSSDKKLVTCEVCLQHKDKKTLQLEREIDASRNLIKGYKLNLNQVQIELTSKENELLERQNSLKKEINERNNTSCE